MYCSSCGSAVAEGLDYCNRCGAKVGGDKSAELSPNLILNAIAVVFIAGLGAIIALLVLTKQPVGFDPIMLAAATFSFLLLIVVETVLFWLLFSSRRAPKKAGAAAAERLKARATKELEEARSLSLPEPLPSVTDHTTRTLEPLYRERKSE